MSRISRNQVPPNGWGFQQGETWIKAETADDLIAKVAAHRASNGLAHGDPWQDIQDQICLRHPSTCLGQASAASPQNNVSTAFQRFRTFATALMAHITTGGEFVDQNTANIRAEICAGCHANVPSSDVKVSGCSSCNKMEDVAITALRSQILGKRKTTSDAKLKTCAICGCCNRLQAWFRLETLGMRQENVNAYPSFCWKKAI